MEEVKSFGVKMPRMENKSKLYQKESVNLGKNRGVYGEGRENFRATVESVELNRVKFGAKKG